MTTKFTPLVTDADRADWVRNDDMLCIAWRRSRKSLGQFVAKNRKLIDSTRRS